MKKNYFIPETTSLSVNAQTMICASETPAPQRQGQIGTMSQTTGSWNPL